MQQNTIYIILCKWPLESKRWRLYFISCLVVVFFIILSRLETKAVGQAVCSSCTVGVDVISLRITPDDIILVAVHRVMLSAQSGYANALFKHNPVSICITIRLHVLRHMAFLFFIYFPASQQLSAPRLDSGQATAEPFCSHTHFHVIPTCRRAQNCQTLSTALDAMCNSFNTRPCRYPYHWCNGVLMPPCILRACTRQLVIRLIYSARPAVDRAAPASCWRSEYGAGHSAAFVLQRWS